MHFAAFFDRCKTSGIHCLTLFFFLSLYSACDDKKDPPKPPPAVLDAGAPEKVDASEPTLPDSGTDAPGALDGDGTDGETDGDGGEPDGDGSIDGDGDAACPDAAKSAELPLKSGVFAQDGLQVIQAIGRAPKSVDMGLARSAASARARAELGKILKKQGIQSDTGQIQGASIESTWRKGRWIYALARIRLENKTKEKDKRVNESTSGSSNSAEPSKTNPTPSDGGRTK